MCLRLCSTFNLIYIQWKTSFVQIINFIVTNNTTVSMSSVSNLISGLSENNNEFPFFKNKNANTLVRAPIIFKIFAKFCNVPRKLPVLELLLNEVSGL